MHRLPVSHVSQVYVQFIVIFLSNCKIPDYLLSLAVKVLFARMTQGVGTKLYQGCDGVWLI